MTTKKKKGCVISALIVLLIGVGAFCTVFYIPYSDSSVEAGQLKQVMHKGFLFKTYEGKLIQVGLKSQVSGGVQSNDFEFSVDDKALAEKLMTLTGKHVQLHYKEYYKALPWRGYSTNIVDKIVSIDTITPPQTLLP